MKTRIVFAFFIVSLANSALLAQVWKPVSASVGFKAKLFGAGVEGTFKGFSGQLQFDPATGNGSLTASVDARTVDTENSLRNRHLRDRESFFNAQKYPSIRMKSTRLEKMASGYVGTFDLTIKNTTRSLRVPFSFTTEGSKGTFSSTFSLNRNDFDLGGNTLGMSDTVLISISITALNTTSQ